jgi:hypothetical protein
MIKASKLKAKPEQFDKTLEAIKQARTETPSLFANIDLYNPDVFGVQQPIKEALDIVLDITPEEIEQKEEKRKAEGSSALKFEKEDKKGRRKGIRFETSRGWGLTPTSVEGKDIISDPQNIRTARFLQIIASLFSYALKRGSFRITNAKITEIIRDTGAYTGKRIDPNTIKNWSDGVILANRTDLRAITPEYSYKDRGGRTITKKVGRYEVFERYVRLFGLQGVLWATDRKGNKTYIKRIIAECLPEITDKSFVRGDVFVKGFFILNSGNEPERVYLAWWILGRFSQKQKMTMQGEPIKADRRFLIEVARYTATDQSNKAEASVKLAEALDRLKELGIIKNWAVLPEKNKKIPTKDEAKIVIYPPQDIIDSLITKPKKPELKPEHIKKLKRIRDNIGLTPTAQLLNTTPAEIEQMLSGGLELTDEQVGKVVKY